MTSSVDGGTTPGPARKFTDRQIIDAAREILAADGVDGLSQRRLAARLGVSHMALYRYFESKDALLDAVVDASLPEVTGAPDARLAWFEQLRDHVVELQEIFVDQPALAALFATRSVKGPRVDAMRERIVSLMLLGGLSQDQSVHGLGVLNRYLAGCAAFASARGGGADSAEADRLGALDAERFPALTAVADRYAEHESSRAAAFGVDLLIDSLRRVAAKGWT